MGNVRKVRVGSGLAHVTLTTFKFVVTCAPHELAHKLADLDTPCGVDHTTVLLSRCIKSPILHFLLCSFQSTKLQPHQINSPNESKANMSSAIDKAKAKMGMGGEKGNKAGESLKRREAREKRREERKDEYSGSSTSSSSEDEQGNKYSEAQRQQRKADHAARREARAKAKGSHHKK